MTPPVSKAVATLRAFLDKNPDIEGLIVIASDRDGDLEAIAFGEMNAGVVALAGAMLLKKATDD